MLSTSIRSDRRVRERTEAKGIYAGGHVTPRAADVLLERLIGVEHVEDMIELRQYFQTTFMLGHLIDPELRQKTE